MFRKLLFTLFILSAVAHATVLTLTAANVTVHNGDDVPPLTYTVSGFAGTDTWTNAVSSGYPSCTTTYTPTSPNGTYPITCAVGTMVANGTYAFNFINGTITVITATGKGALHVAVPIQPAGMMQNVTVSNGTCAAMVGDGVTDNTTAINCLLHTGRTGNVTYGRFPKQFYFPTGTYLVSGQILTYGSAELLTGDGPGKTIIKLASASTGYTSAATPGDWVYFSGAVANGSNNNGYNQQIENIGFEVGPGNPGAIAISFLGNNIDAIYNVKVWFDDGQGVAGIATNHAYPGQTLVKNFSVYGGTVCDRGINEQEYNMVFENLTCENQTTYAIQTAGYQTSVRNFFSVNTVPAWNNTNGGDVLINGECIGTGAGNCIQNLSPGTLYVRNMTCTGYANCMTDSNGSVTLTNSFAEHWSGTAQTLFSTTSPTGIIFATDPETPIPNDPVDGSGVLIGTPLGPDPSTWNATAASCPSSGVLYVPVQDNCTSTGCSSTNDASYTGQYTPPTGTYNITVPDCINHIMFNNMTFLSGATTVNFISTGTGTTPLIIDHAGTSASAPTVTQNSSRPVVVADTFLFYTAGVGAGDVYFQDAEIQNSTTLALPTFASGQNIYGRALDQESLGPSQCLGTIAYVSSVHIMTLAGGCIDPNMVVGDIIYISGISTAAGQASWANGTSIKVLSISGTTITGSWNNHTNPDYPATTQTQGNYRDQYPHIVCTGCNIWMLGYKTEDSGPLLVIKNGKAEVLGGFWYVVRDPTDATPAFTFTDTNAAVTGSMFHSCCTHESFWQYWITETRNGVTGNLSNPSYPQSGALANMNLFYSIGAGAPPTPFPTKFFGGKLTGDSVH